jgi:hypothetical protein
MHADSVLLTQDGTNMAASDKLNKGNRIIKKSEGSDSNKYGSYSLGSGSYSFGDGKEYYQSSRKTKLPGVQKLVGQKYEVPKGTMKTAKAERGKTAARVTNVAKRAEVAAVKKVAIKKLAKNTAQAERGKTVARKTSVAKRQTAAKEAARKPKRLY